MNKKLKLWFDGFNNGINSLNQKEKEKFFCECGKKCAENNVLKLYKAIYDRVNGNLDLFFESINNIKGVRAEVVEGGRKYNLIFESCVCEMHNKGYINNPYLCECSRQSIIYVMNSIVSNKESEVEIHSTVLRGGNECEFSITVNDKK